MYRPILPVLLRLIPVDTLRSILLLISWGRVKDVMNITDVMRQKSAEIWEEKKRLYAIGDKSVVNEFGEGKDIMSILRQLSYLF